MIPLPRTPFLVAALAALLALAPRAARAQGFVVDIEGPGGGDSIEIKRHRPHEPLNPIALASYRVESKIVDQIAKTRVRQRFENRAGRDLEATYVFPIPPGASCSDFVMNVAGREMKAEILDRDRARSIYEDIVRRKKDPALLELIGNGLLRARVFPVPARGTVEVSFTLEESLEEDSGLRSYRLPLRIDRFATAPPEELAVFVDVESSRRIASIHSPSHRVDVSRRDECHARVSLEERGQGAAADDFALVIGTTDQEFGLHLVTSHSPGEDGFFQLLLSPARDFPDDTIGRKDFVFVLDTSGSMQGTKFTQATGALLFALGRLRPGDRFALVPFSTEPRPFRDGLVPATPENLEAARAFVASLSAVGGTNIAEALRAGLGALASGRDPSRVPLCVFLTDGLPTVSETDPSRILESAKRLADESRCRLFVFGVGNDVNSRLLDRLAEDNRGARDYVVPGEDIEVKVGSLVSKIESPVLSDLRIEFDGVTVRDLHPKSIPDLFRGQQVSLVGRFAGEGRHRVRLTGRVGGATRTYSYEADFSSRRNEHPTVARLWAERRVGFLLDEIRLRGENRELKDEVERLSKRFGIVTPYTALLVTEDETRDFEGFMGSVGPRGDAGAARDLNSLGYIGAARPGASAPAPSPEIGASLDLKRMREADRASAPPADVRLVQAGRGGRGGDGPAAKNESYEQKSKDDASRDRQEAALRVAGDKAFQRDADGVWVDTSIGGAAKLPEPTRVVAYSKEYFDLLERVPALKPFFALGERVKVLYDGTLYVVVTE